jgi:hypothetical protein
MRASVSPSMLFPTTHRFVVGMRVILTVWVAIAVLQSLPDRSLAAGSRANETWQASAALFTEPHGRWKPARSVASLGMVRGVLTVHGRGLAGSTVKATMALRHRSWRGHMKVIMAPTVVVRMTRIAVSNQTATFTVDVQVPTLLPVYWSLVTFQVSNGHTRAVARSGIMVGRPAKQTSFNTLTISRANAFCDNRPRLPYLVYAVYLHAYFVGLYKGGDGPPPGIMLDRPRHVTPTILRDRRKRAYPYGIFTGSMRDFGIPRNGWVTLPGLLSCARGKPAEFAFFQ